MALKRIRLFIADKHEIIRVGLGVYLRSAEDIVIVGEARNGLQTLDLVEQLSPDVVLLDFELPGLNGIQIALELKRRASPTRILLMSSQEAKNYVLAMFRSGASGFLSKRDLPDDFIRAVREVAAGTENWLSQRMEEKMAVWQSSPQDKIFFSPPSNRVRAWDLADEG